MVTRACPLCSGAHVVGQIEQGSLVGIVTDPQKAPVAGAIVEFRSLATNVKREAVTNVERRI